MATVWHQYGISMASPCQVLAKYLSTACHLRIDGMWSKMPAKVYKSPVARKRHDAQTLKLRWNGRGEVLVRLSIISRITFCMKRNFVPLHSGKNKRK